MADFNDPFGAAGGGQYGGGTSPYQQSAAAKSKLTAGLLGIFLGSLGVHNFYLGFRGKAIAQLLITILTVGYGAIVTVPWSIVEAIMILVSKSDKDASGVPLT
jgi:TM2 domain-containing membrane protein YozV